MGETFGKIRSDLAMLPHGNGVHEDVLNRYVNDRYKAMLSAFPWTRLNITATLQVPAAYTTGTLAILNGATTGTITGGTFTEAMNGRRIRIASGPEWYTFGFVDASNFTIDRAYEAVTQTAAGFRIWQAVFELPSAVDVFESASVPRLGLDLNQKSREWLDVADAGRTLETGGPLVFVPIDDSQNGFAQIEFYPGTDTAEGISIRYRQKVPRITNAATEFLDWIDTETLFAGVEADLYGLQGNLSMKTAKELDWEKGLQRMMTKDTQRMSAGQMQMSEEWTQHRIERAAGASGKLSWWNADSRWGAVD